RSLATARLDRRAARDSGSKALRAAVRAGDHEQQERLRLRQRQAELLAAAVIRVSDTCHGGVVLRFGNAEFSPDTALGPSAFRYDSERRTIVRGEL
ncbi:MAG: hypothetical protein KDE27_19730, partial [Planctomycetes bacterium]|nr:hypothetical protein [Planctomycetota bacterium]